MAGFFRIPNLKSFEAFGSSSTVSDTEPSTSRTETATPLSAASPFPDSEFGKHTTEEHKVSEEMSYKVYKGEDDAFLKLKCFGETATFGKKEATWVLDNLDTTHDTSFTTKKQEIDIKKLTKGWTQIDATDSKSRETKEILFNSDERRYLEENSRRIKEQLDTYTPQGRAPWECSPFTSCFSNQTRPGSSLFSSVSPTQAPWEGSPFSD